MIFNQNIFMGSDVDILSNPKKALWKLSVPIMILSIFQAGYSLVDMYWMSQMSQQAFFAISVTSPLITLMNGFGSAVATGANSIISRELGNNEILQSDNSILHAIIACIILALIMIASLFFLDDILAIMNVTSSVDLAIAYITPMYLFSIVFLLSSLFSSTLQSEGNTTTSTRILIVTNIVNIILDPILIFTLNLGVRGAAYASIISTSISVVYFLYWYLSGKSEVELNFKYFKPGIVYEIFVVAIPNFIMSILSSVLVMYANKVLIAQLDEIGVLLYSTAWKIESLLVSPQKALTKSLVTVIGQLFGADNWDDIKMIYRYTIKVSVILAVIATVAFFFVRDYGFALYSVTGVETYVFYIAVAAILIVPCEEIRYISNSTLDGLGKSYHSLIMENALTIFEIVAIGLMAPVFTSGFCVFYGIILGEVIFAIASIILIGSIFLGKNKMEKKIVVVEEDIETKKEEHEPEIEAHKEKVEKRKEKFEDDKEKVKENIEAKKEEHKEKVEEHKAKKQENENNE